MSASAGGITSPVSVGGESVSLPAGPSMSIDVPAFSVGGVSMPGLHVGGAAGDILPFTGTGPGTLPLLILGVISILVGFCCALFGKAAPARRHDDRWPDISDRSLVAAGVGEVSDFRSNT